MWPSYLINFRYYGLQKTWLDKCLKSPVSEHRSTVDMLKRPKHYYNLHGSTFIIFSHHSERNKVKLKQKYLSWCYLKFHYCWLTYWLPIISIIFVIGRIYSNPLKCNCLKNKKFFLNFLPYFWNLHQILNIFFKKRYDPHSLSISEIIDCERLG